MHIETEELVTLMKNMKINGITGLEIVMGKKKVRLTRESGVHSPMSAAPRIPAPDHGVHEGEKGSQNMDVISDSPEGEHEITSPLVGTFYHAPSPDAPPFVSVGDRVEDGQTLCIVEAMKTMNEIKADRSGRIREIRAENGKMVEYGQTLFVVSEG